MRLSPALLVAAALALAGCVYKIDVQQGNVVIQEQLDKVKPGMTKPQVRQLLGTPLLADPFHASRWDYWFYNEKRGVEVEKNRITILFDGDVVKSVEGVAPVAIKGEERKK
jgi:outer membrane protein assembly factor BamE